MEEIAQVLLVEDNKMNIALTPDAFHEAKIFGKIQVALHGEEALQYLLGEEKLIDGNAFPLPNIVLPDLKMPENLGIEVLKIIKTTPEIRRIPVIVITSSKEEEDRAVSYDNGANSYLLKPISFDDFPDPDVTMKYRISLDLEPPLTVM